MLSMVCKPGRRASLKLWHSDSVIRYAIAYEMLTSDVVMGGKRFGQKFITNLGLTPYKHLAQGKKERGYTQGPGGTQVGMKVHKYEKKAGNCWYACAR